MYHYWIKTPSRNNKYINAINIIHKNVTNIIIRRFYENNWQIKLFKSNGKARK